MSMFRIFDVSGSASSAQSQRLNTVASNLANADTVAGPNGQAYKARQVVFQTQPMGTPGRPEGAAGVAVTQVTEDETPFLGAIKWSRFGAAERLLRHGANVNFQNSKGLTALHLILKKNSDRRHVEMLLRYGADPTIKAKDGKSPLDLVRDRRDKTYFTLLSRRQAAPSP